MPPVSEMEDKGLSAVAEIALISVRVFSVEYTVQKLRIERSRMW